jgi:translation elongation factor EF-Tu-like GTPase
MVNVISKADLVDKEDLDKILDMESAGLLARTDPRALNGRLANLTR